MELFHLDLRVLDKTPMVYCNVDERGRLVVVQILLCLSLLL